MDAEKDSGHQLGGYARTDYDDAYGEGFSDGRKSMAISIVRNMLEKFGDDEIAGLTGMNSTEVAAIRNPAPEAPEEVGQGDTAPATTADGDSPQLTFLRESPLHGTALVEPRFVKLVRTIKGLTQTRLAQILGVHPDTVSTWETAEMPVRMKTATYERLHSMLPGSITSQAAAEENIDEV